MTSEGAIVEVEPAQMIAPVEHSEVEAHDFSGYRGAATLAVSTIDRDALAVPFADEDHDILPTGEVYVSQVHVRRRLNKVFRPGGWALVPRGPFVREGNSICREYALLGPGGRFLSEAIGEADYQPTNERMSYASACEASKSNALTRCCKDLGIAAECWDRRFAERWKAEWCISVWRRTKVGKENKPQWRRKDAPPWFDETREVEVRESSVPAAQKPAASPAGTAPSGRDPRADLASAAKVLAGMTGGDPEAICRAASEFAGKEGKVNFFLDPLAKRRDGSWQVSDKWASGVLGKVLKQIELHEGRDGADILTDGPNG